LPCAEVSRYNVFFRVTLIGSGKLDLPEGSETLATTSATDSILIVEGNSMRHIRKSVWSQVTRAILCITTVVFISATAIGEIRGPILGYLFDKTEKAIRPIWGVPGASRLGEVVPIGLQLVRAQVAPGLNFALGIALDGGVVLVDLKTTDQVSVHPLSELPAGAEGIYLSHSGRSAALIYPETKRLRILTGLPESVSLLREVDLSMISTPHIAALSEDGAFVALGTNESQVGSLFLYSKDFGLQLLGTFGNVSALKLLDADQIVGTDRQSNEVFLIRDLLGVRDTVTLATQEEGVSRPAALEVSRDGRRVFVANEETGTIMTLNLNGGPVTITPCQCKPAALGRLEGDSVFRLTDLSNGPLLMLDADNLQSRVLFVSRDGKPSIQLPQRGQSRPLRIPRRTNAN
jgi:hypothetical protein